MVYDRILCSIEIYGRHVIVHPIQGRSSLAQAQFVDKISYVTNSDTVHALESLGLPCQLLPVPQKKVGEILVY